jgi:hypothetical protein
MGTSEELVKEKGNTMIWFIVTIPFMLLAVAIATLPVLFAMRHGSRPRRAEIVLGGWPTVKQLEERDVQLDVRSAA